MAPTSSGNPPSTCLFLPELPPDLSDSILERHFRGFVGFASCRTRHDRNGKLVGFVEFEQIDDAVRCRDSMQGTSPFPGISWHIHFSNNVKSGGAPGGAPSKRPREEMGPPMPRHEAQRPSYGAPMGMPPPSGYPREDSRYAPSPQQVSPHMPPGGPPPYGAYAMTPHAPPPSDPMGMQPAPVNYLGISLPHDASSTLYIEGLPSDATEREVAHVFRKYEGLGFQSVRMRAIESNKTPGTNLFLCFAEFDNPHQATIALYGLQGYRFDTKVENSAIRISYAKAKGARPPPRAPPPRFESGGSDGAYMPREPPRDERRSSDERDRYDDDRGRGYDDERGRSGNRRYESREHHDGYRDDYEDSERGDDDVFQRAEQVSMHGVTDT